MRKSVIMKTRTLENDKLDANSIFNQDKLKANWNHGYQCGYMMMGALM